MGLKQPIAGVGPDDITNVYLFIADSTRLDALPDRLIGEGCAFKTAAHALLTAQSVPTMLSGQLPPRHGVTWFNGRVPDDYKTLLDLDDQGHHTAYKQHRWASEHSIGMRDVLNASRQTDLEALEEPFFVVDHDFGGHAPYPTRDGETIEETFTEFAGDHAGIRDVYDTAVAESTAFFENQLAKLEDQGVLDDTLVIYTGDHGELLGEHGGHCSHIIPHAPEAVYVPTVFLHPDIEPAAPYELPLLHHTDLAPTILDFLGADWEAPFDGESLLDGIAADRPAYANGFMHSPGFLAEDGLMDPAYDAPGVWTRNGGYTFNETEWWKRPFLALYDAQVSDYTSSFLSDYNVLRRIAATAGMYFPNVKTYGTPGVSREEAREISERVRSEAIESERRELTEAQKEGLEDLGYL